MNNPADRRQFTRAPVNMLVQHKPRDMSEFMREYAVNISAGGMFVRTTEPRPMGAMIYLQFALASGEKLIEGLAEVVHVNPPDHQNPGMGLEFVNLDDESRELIEQIVQQRLEDQET